MYLVSRTVFIETLLLLSTILTSTFYSLSTISRLFLISKEAIRYFLVLSCRKCNKDGLILISIRLVAIAQQLDASVAEIQMTADNGQFRNTLLIQTL